MFWWKFAKFFLSFSKPQVSFSLFLGQTLYTLHEKDQSERKFFRLLSAQINIHQILVIFERTNWFLFKFCTTLQYHDIYIIPLYFFTWNFIYFQQKEPIKVQIWWNFTWAVKSLKYCTLMGCFCKNHVKFQLKSTEELSLMTLKSDAKFKEKLTCGFKYDMKDLVNFPKYIRFELKKIQSYLSWNWTVMQNKPCGLGVSKMAFEELCGISLEHSKVWKIVHWWALFVQSI